MSPPQRVSHRCVNVPMVVRTDQDPNRLPRQPSPLLSPRLPPPRCVILHNRRAPASQQRTGLPLRITADGTGILSGGIVLAHSCGWKHHASARRTGPEVALGGGWMLGDKGVLGAMLRHDATQAACHPSNRVLAGGLGRTRPTALLGKGDSP